VRNPEPKAIHPWAYATWLSGSWVNEEELMKNLEQVFATREQINFYIAGGFGL